MVKYEVLEVSCPAKREGAAMGTIATVKVRTESDDVMEVFVHLDREDIKAELDRKVAKRLRILRNLKALEEMVKRKA